MQAEATGDPVSSPPGEESAPCARCLGTGWQIVADGGNGAARPCDCRKRRIGRELLERAGIPERHRHCRLENFSTANRTAGEAVRLAQKNAKQRSERYIESFIDLEAARPRSSGLIYIGPPGTGKTHLAAAVLTALIERYGVRGRFVNFSHLVYQIQATFDPSSTETKRQVLERVTQAEVLVLDELGATKPTEFVQDTLYLLMNERYSSNLPTIFTTNYHLEEIKPGAGKPDRRSRADAMADAVSDGGVAGRMSRPGGRLAHPAASDSYELLAARISPVLVSRLYEMSQPITVGNWDYRHHVMLPRRLHGRS